MTGKKKEGQNENTLIREMADIVRKRILNGEYQIGEKIKESPIANELNVSRTPIRKVFKMLEKEGLLEHLPNKGYYAKGFTKQDISDVYMVCEVLENLAITWACERINDEEIKSLEEQCKCMDLYAIKRDAKKTISACSSFHDIIYNSTRSRFLARLLRSYKEYLGEAKDSIYIDEMLLKRIRREHYDILDAIKERNVEKAIQGIREHLRISQELSEQV